MQPPARKPARSPSRWIRGDSRRLACMDDRRAWGAKLMSLVRKDKPLCGAAPPPQRHKPARYLDSKGNSPSVSSEMANKAEKWKDNAAGKFYVDQQCIDCD